jgi:hypothetical protein
MDVSRISREARQRCPSCRRGGPGPGNLHWVHVSGCDTLFGNGGPAAYAIFPPQVIPSP